MENLKQKSVEGVLWNAFRFASIYLIELVVFIVLARYLSVDEFGLMVFCMLIVEFARVFTNVGINQSLVQRETWDASYTSSVFTVILILSVCVCSLLGAVGYWVALTFHSQTAAYVVLTLACLPILSSLSPVFSGKLEREFRNYELASVRSGSTLIGGILTIGLVVAGFGLWSLVYGKIAQGLIQLICFIVLSKFKPKIQIHNAHYDEFKRFCVPLLGMAIDSYARDKGSSIVCGMFLGTQSLAFLAVVTKAMTILKSTLLSSVAAMILPSFSRLDAAAKSAGFYKVIEQVSLVTLPIYTGTAIVANETILLAFGEKFEESVLILQLMIIPIPMILISYFIPNILITMGRNKLAFKLGFLETCGNLLVSIAFLWFGLEVFVLALTIYSIIISPVKLMIARQYFAFEWIKIGEALKPSLMCCLSMVAVCLLLKLYAFNTLPLSLNLIMTSITGAVVYYSTLHLLYPESLSRIKNLRKAG